jgi:hypothetical protein
LKSAKEREKRDARRHAADVVMPDAHPDPRVRLLATSRPMTGESVRSLLVWGRVLDDVRLRKRAGADAGYTPLLDGRQPAR